MKIHNFKLSKAIKINRNIKEPSKNVFHQHHQSVAENGNYKYKLKLNDVTTKRIAAIDLEDLDSCSPYRNRRVIE